MGYERRYLLPATVRGLPADLAATIGLTVLAVFVAVVPGVKETPLRVVFGLPFVLFLPGYAFIALLFPEAGAGPAMEKEDSGTEEPTEGAPEQSDSTADGLTAGQIADRGIDGIERVALSFGLSIAVVPLIGLGLNFTPWGIRLAPILVSVGGFTIGCTIGAAYRRWELPPEDRFRVPYRQWFDAAHSELVEPEDRTDAALNVLLVASILLAVGSVGYAVAVPKQGESFTEFYLLTENEEDELVADGYPEELVQGEPAELVVGIGNQEHRATDYTVVVQLQNVTIEDNETIVRERRELDRYRTSLAHNETWQHRHAVTPTLTGERLRLQYLLYRGEPPENPTGATAYRDLHLWVDVSESTASR